MTRELFNLLGVGLLFIPVLILVVVVARKESDYEPCHPLWLVVAMVAILWACLAGRAWDQYGSTLPSQRQELTGQGK